MYPDTQKKLEIMRNIIDLLAAEGLSLVAAEEILAGVVMRIRYSSLVQDSSHTGYNRPSNTTEDNPFKNLPFRIDKGFDK